MRNPRLVALGLGVLTLLAGTARSESPFATTVVEYRPAPGQFVSHSSFNEPEAALGPPHGGGTSAPNNESVVTLGGFGGHVVLTFEHTVLDDPMNAFGVDAIVFGNAYWVGGNPQRHWAECATIEISLDQNENGQADDPWFLIPGSHLPDPPAAWTQAYWDDDIDDLLYPPDDELWIAEGFVGTWTTQAFALGENVFSAGVVVNPQTDGIAEGIHGYADYAPTLILGDLNADNAVDDPTITAEAFYSTPDDPRTVGISPGAGGGDAIDIAWAVDPISGALANLNGFDFIRITSAVNAVSPVLGEISAEIDAVADVSPDPFGDSDLDHDIDLLDIAQMQVCFMQDAQINKNVNYLMKMKDGVADLEDVEAFMPRLTGPRS